MKSFSRLFRLIHIQFVLVRYNLDEFILATPWFYPVRFLTYFNPFYWSLRKKLSRGERMRLALSELGPIFVKAGQLLSTRRDFVPEDIANELAKLQDRVPPFPGETAKSIIEASLNCPIESIFTQLDLTPLASASIAQVHAGTLLNGKSVVVKVLRPGIRKIIDRDLDLLLILAKLMERYSDTAARLKPRQIVAEIAQTLHDELDLLREGANATQLRRNFHDSFLLYVPEIYWEFSRPAILVQERISGIPIYDLNRLKQSGMNMRKIAECGIEIFFTQIFRDSFFHADLHPGNLFISEKDKNNPQYIAVDFGIVGSLNTQDQRYIAENMLAFFKRDYRKVAELHVASGWLPPDARVDQFEGAIRAVCEPIFDKPLRDISFGQLLLKLFQVARRFEINIQPQLILLQKTLLSIEGLCRQLSPDLDLWAEAAPHLERWLKRQLGVRAFFRRIRENLPLWSEQLPELPSLIYEMMKEKRLKQEMEHFTAQHAVAEKPKSTPTPSRYFISGSALGLLLSSGLLLTQTSIALPLVYTLGGAGILLLGIAALTG